MSVGALEPQFYAELVRRLELDLPDRNDPANCPAIRAALTATVQGEDPGRVVGGLRRHRRLRGGDHPADRGLRPTRTSRPAAPSSRTTASRSRRRRRASPAPCATITMPPGGPGAHTREALAAWGVDDIDALHRAAAARGPGLIVRPFLFLGTRAEDDVAQQEYDAVLAGTGLRPRRAGPRPARGRHPRRRSTSTSGPGSSWAAGPSTSPIPTTSSHPRSTGSRPSSTSSPTRGGGRRPVPRRLLRHRGARRPGGRRRRPDLRGAHRGQARAADRRGQR